MMDAADPRIEYVKSAYVEGLVEVDELERAVEFFVRHPGPLPASTECEVDLVLRLFYAPSPNRDELLKQLAAT